MCLLKYTLIFFERQYMNCNFPENSLSVPDIMYSAYIRVEDPASKPDGCKK